MSHRFWILLLPPVLCVLLCGSARADTTATITPSISPDRHHAKSALTLTIHYSGSEGGLPSPIRHAVLRLPAGLSLNIPALRSCSVARLQAGGAGACPAQSSIGGGYALVEGHVGAQLATERVSLQAFLGPPNNDLQPTFEILSEGFRPVGAQFILPARALPARAPYGEALVMSVPPIPTVPNEPDASVLTFSLTIGSSGPHRGRGGATVLLPSRCAPGGLPFEAEFTYADGSSGSAVARSPCPRAASPSRGRAARTISLDESGRLHLTSKHGFTLEEQGPASGSVTGTIYVRLRIVSTSRVTAEVSISPRGGSISGVASASYHRGSSSATFSGSLSITGGTGSYAHAHGSGLSFSGTIQRSNDAISAHVGGTVSE